jgi:hypothetical protein
MLKRHHSEVSPSMPSSVAFDQIDKIHGAKIPHLEKVWGEEFGAANSTLGQDITWAHNWDMNPNPEDVVADWKPPEWCITGDECRAQGRH